MDQLEPKKAGFLIMRTRKREGVKIGQDIEVRVTSIEPNQVTGELEVELAVRAPKEIPIRRLR